MVSSFLYFNRHLLKNQSVIPHRSSQVILALLLVILVQLMTLIRLLLHTDDINSAGGTFGTFLYRGVRGLMPRDLSRRFSAFESNLGICVSHATRT